MAKQKDQTPTIEMAYAMYEKLQFDDKISYFKLIKVDLENKATIAKNEISKLSEVVDKH